MTKQLKSVIFLFGAILMVALTAPTEIAAHPSTRVSPHDVSTANIGGARVSVYYGRPSIKDPKTGEVRKIWGGLVPYGKVWRTGANEATLLVVQKPIVIGGTKLAAGAYTLFTLPMEDGSAKLIINSEIGQWGTQYDESKDIARIDLKKTEVAETVDPFTIAVSKSGDEKSGVIELIWEKTAYSVAFQITE